VHSRLIAIEGNNLLVYRGSRYTWPMPPTLHHADDVLRIVIDRGLCVARWADTPEAPHFPLVTAAMREAARELGRAGLFNVIDAPGKMPRFSEAVRQAGTRMSRDITPVAAATAHVVLLDGFSGAAVRMFLSTLSLLARGGPVTTVHSTLQAGAEWLAMRAPGEWTAQRISAAYALACR
jgi:hypothetical protein